jgi:hypothetical protein
MNSSITELEFVVLESLAKTGFKKITEISIEGWTHSDIYELLLHMQKSKLLQLSNSTAYLSKLSKKILSEKGVATVCETPKSSHCELFENLPRLLVSLLSHRTFIFILGSLILMVIFYLLKK